MARLERRDLVQFRDYDDKRVDGLIELWAEHGVTAPVRRIRYYLIDRWRFPPVLPGVVVNHVCEAKGEQDAKADGAQESFGEFVIASNASPVALDSLEETFYPRVRS